MSDKQLKAICDIASEAHSRIQQNFKDINPVVGVTHNMRSNGVPADAMTIDCLKSGKRIILVLHDQQPDIIYYQFSFKDKDPGSDFESIQFNEFTTSILYDWIKTYFS